MDCASSQDSQAQSWWQAQKQMLKTFAREKNSEGFKVVHHPCLLFCLKEYGLGLGC